MTKKTVFQGAATALITPMNKDGIDYDNFARLIDWQIESGIDALVICGTTGESATLSDDEHRDASLPDGMRPSESVPDIFLH